MTPCLKALACLILTAVGPAYSQTATGDAEHLFREGKRLMSEGNVSAACDAFEGSQRVGPAVTTLLNLADCREKNHQFASAWGAFVEAARLSRGQPDSVALFQVASERSAKLEPRLSYLTISVPLDAHVEGMTIHRNGVAIDEAMWNHAVPVDGGDYLIEAKSPGREPWSTVVRVDNAKARQSVDVPRFEVARQGRNENRSIDHATGRPSAWYSDKIGWSVAGGGVVALGVGLALRSSGASLDDQANDSQLRQSARMDLRDRASSRLTIGAIVGGAGAALLVAGGIKLALTDDKGASSQRARVSWSLDGVTFGGSF